MNRTKKNKRSSNVIQFPYTHEFRKHNPIDPDASLASMTIGQVIEAYVGYYKNDNNYQGNAYHDVISLVSAAYVEHHQTSEQLWDSMKGRPITVGDWCKLSGFSHVKAVNLRKQYRLPIQSIASNDAASNDAASNDGNNKPTLS